MKYSLRWIEARKRFIELCEVYGDGSSKQSIELGNLWRSWAEYDDGDGSVVAKKVQEFYAKLIDKSLSKLLTE